MKRRIFLSSLWLILTSIIVLSSALSLLFRNAANESEKAAVRDYTSLIASILGSGLSGDYRYSDYLNRDPRAPRVTVISPDGTVLLDSWAFADRLENHSDRAEFIQAFQSGRGESQRYSATLQADMFYYAVKLDDGNVLRVSKPISDIRHVFSMLVPVTISVAALVLLLSVFATRRLTVSIIKPLENIDFDSENTYVYDELAPYMRKIEQQKRDIEGKLYSLTERADTIETITGSMKEGLILIDKKGDVLTANNSAREIFMRDEAAHNMESPDSAAHNETGPGSTAPDSSPPGAMACDAVVADSVARDAAEHETAALGIEHKSILYICRELDFHNAVNRCLSGENVEIRMERGGRIYNVYMNPVSSGGTARGAVILFQDATEKHEAEMQRKQFSANVSHELKTPLTTISALSEMIESGMARDGDVGGFAARITEQAGRLLVLIDDIIRLSEFDEGGVVKEYSEFDVHELAGTVIRAIRDNGRAIEFEMNGGRVIISANRRMIEELLYNLIDNGVKYNKDGGRVTVDISLTNDRMCKIAVSDTGIGIAEAHQKHIFERFYRVDESRSKKTGGTGLGLSIVKHISEYHGGRVELQSAEGVGTTVTCYIKAE